MGVSLKPSDAVEGGGLLDDVDVTITKSRFAMFDYGGKAQPVPAIMWELDAGDGTSPITQYWSVGKALDWMPSDDGKELVPIGKSTQLVNSSNGMVLLSSVVNAGVPESKLGADISIFEGMECHVNRVAAPERKGIQNRKENQTILVVTKIHKLPWEKGNGKAKAKGKGGGSKAAPAATDTAADIDAITTEFIIGVLSNDDKMKDYPDGMPKAKFAPEVFAAFPADNPNRSGIIQKILTDDKFLKAGPWKYEGGKLSLG